MNRKRRQGSLTVEASIVCPFYIFALLAFVNLLMWYQTAQKIQTGLIQQARAQMASVTMENIYVTKSYKLDFGITVLDMIQPDRKRVV